MSRDEILDALRTLLPAQFDDLVFRLRVPPEMLSGPQAPQLQRAMEVIRYLESGSRLQAIVPLLRPGAPPAAPIASMPASPAASPPVAPVPATSAAAPLNVLADPALEELAEAYASRNLILFAGAGVSATAGLPSWRRLVELLSDRARARGAAVALLDEVAGYVQRSQYIDALSALEQALGAPDFSTAVERALDDRGRAVPELGQAIVALAPRLRAVLTTNIDGLLERAFAGAWPAIARATGDIAQRRGYILKLHGTLLERATWVFTRAQYDRAQYADPLLQGAFSALFHACPLLFVGYGLADDDFDQLLARVRALAGAQPPRHFALVAAETIAPFRRTRLENAGIRIIAYGNADGRHGAVTEILRALAARP